MSSTMTRLTDEDVADLLDRATRHVAMLQGTRFENQLGRAFAVIDTCRWVRGEADAPLTGTAAAGPADDVALIAEWRRGKGDEERAGFGTDDALRPGVVAETIDYLRGHPHTIAPI